MSDPVLPVWGSVALALMAPIGGIVTFVLGRSSKAGADAETLKTLCRDFAITKGLVEDMVLTTNSHTQSLGTDNGRINALELSMRAVEVGLSTLTERTRKL